MVSVIVPAYNAEKFLRECLESIKTQSFGDFECIVIDDGSQDNTSRIAEEFADSDARFKVIKVPNGGVSRARNLGVEEAVGELITFVDADDILHRLALERLLSVMQNTGADVCISAFKSFRNRKEIKNYKKNDSAVRLASTETYSYVEAMKLALYQKRLLNSPWGMLIKRSAIGNERFQEGIRYEDLDAFYRFFRDANLIAYLPSPLYFYRHNPESFLQTWSDARLDVLDVTDRMADYFRNTYPDLVDAASDRRFSAHFNMLLEMNHRGVNNDAAKARCLAVIKEGRRKALRDRNVRLKNKIGALCSYGGMPVIRLFGKLS